MGSASLKRMIRENLSRRFLLQGGIAGLPKGRFRSDATAWGILAFQAADGEQLILEKHRARLIEEQGRGGGLAVDAEHPDSCWPTALAVLAWKNSPASGPALSLAVRFLLESTGLHAPRNPDDAWAHDTSLKGWPWTKNTHSWIEPTAISVMALRAAGYGRHDRVKEAIHMILDRQLPHGGWNYGNTIIFGRELHPMPETTGAALAASAGTGKREQIVRSLEYAQREVERHRTPISLGWLMLGLAAWNLWPTNGPALVERCLANQSRYGEYDTSALSLLFLGALAGQKDNNDPLLPDPGADVASA